MAKNYEFSSESVTEVSPNIVRNIKSNAFIVRNFNAPKGSSMSTKISKDKKSEFLTYIRENFNKHSQREDHLEKIRNIISSSKPLLYSPVTKSYRLIANSKNLCRKLMNLGVVPRKSLIVKFPSIPSNSLRHFLRGAIDGDGSVRYFKRKRSPYFEISICSGSLDFCSGFVEAVKTNTGISANIRNTNNNLYVARYACSRGKKLAEYIYSNSTIFLERKYASYKDNVLEG